MSLAIDVDRVHRVLLADGWHTVDDWSFTLDAYEYLWYANGPGRDPIVLHGGGQVGVCATGFCFTDEEGGRISGPLTAILAIREAPSWVKPSSADVLDPPARQED